MTPRSKVCLGEYAEGVGAEYGLSIEARDELVQFSQVTSAPCSFSDYKTDSKVNPATHSQAPHPLHGNTDECEGERMYSCY